MCIRDRTNIEAVLLPNDSFLAVGFLIAVSYTHLDVYKRQIQNFPTPKNKKQLQSFLGICNYYRKFQTNYSYLTAKFSKQLSAKEKWTWGKEQDEVLKLIKIKFLETIMLHHPNIEAVLFFVQASPGIRQYVTNRSVRTCKMCTICMCFV